MTVVSNCLITVIWLVDKALQEGTHCMAVTKIFEGALFPSFVDSKGSLPFTEPGRAGGARKASPGIF